MGKKLNIGFDVDGVFLDFWCYIIEKALYHFKKIDEKILIDSLSIKDISKLERLDKQLFLEKYINEYSKKTGDVIDITEFEITKMFNCSYIERQWFWMKNIYQYCKNSSYIEESVKFTKKWQSEGHATFIISSREFVTKYGFLGDLFRHLLNKKFEEQNLKFDEIIYCSDKEKEFFNSKVVACNALQLDVMIEDLSSNIDSISNINTVICFDAPHNRKPYNKNVIRVKKFSEADKFIQELTNNNYIKYKFNEDIKLLNSEKERLLNERELLNYYQQLKKFFTELPNNYPVEYNYDYPRDKKEIKKVNKKDFPYPNQLIGSIFLFNTESLDKKIEIAYAIPNKKILILSDTQNFFLQYIFRTENEKIGIVNTHIFGYGEALKNLISVVSRGGSVLVSDEKDAEIIAKITGSPVMFLEYSDKKLNVVGTRIVKRNDKIDGVDQKIKLLSNNSYI